MLAANAMANACIDFWGSGRERISAREVASKPRSGGNPEGGWPPGSNYALLKKLIFKHELTVSGVGWPTMKLNALDAG